VAEAANFDRLTRKDQYIVASTSTLWDIRWELAITPLKLDRMQQTPTRLVVAQLQGPRQIRRNTTVAEDINVLALVKGSEKYIFLYSDSNRSQALRVLGRYASNPDLSFSWYDAAVLSQKIRRQLQAKEEEVNRSARFQLPQMTDECHDDLV
jgi:hypothetical protein